MFGIVDLFSVMLSNGGMKTVDEIRKANLIIAAAECGGAGKFAEKIGKSASQVSQWMNGSLNSVTGKPRVISSTSCREIEVALGKPIGWMDVEHDNILKGFNFIPVEVLDDDHPSLVKIRMVKLRLSAGITGFQMEPDYEEGGTLSLSRRWIEKSGLSPDRLIGIKVKGESMEPTLYADDTVILDLSDTSPVEGRVYAINYEGEAVVKRMTRDVGEWWLTSDNPDQRKYHRKMCRGSECLIIGRVVRKESDRI